MSSSTDVLTLSGCPYPQARIQSADAESGRVVFDWLDASGNPVDSGGSLVHLPPATELTPEAVAQAIESMVATPESAPVPSELTRFRFIVALRRELGLTEGAVNALLSQMPDGDTKETARDGWENASVFKRSHALVVALAQINGTSDAEMNDLFRAGAAYTDLD